MPVDYFDTQRLTARHWRRHLADATERRALEEALSGILTARVLEHLPPSLQLSHHGGRVSDWISACAAQSDVLLVQEAGHPVGLLILAAGAGASGDREIHIGYLLAETAWGRGLASELVAGLVSAMEAGEPVILVAGVGRENPASARVLRKCGFRLSRARCVPGTDIYVRCTKPPPIDRRR